MEKPLYILIFLLLWSTRIRGGEEEDIDGTLSPSTQKNGDRNSLIDKASSSTITKTSTIFDPDSESSETESSKTESKALETNTGTEEPSVANYVTPKPARDSSEIQSSPIKPEAPKTTNASTRTGTKTTLSNLDLESSETDFASVKSEATEIKPGSLETDSPPNKSKEPRTNTDSTTAKTTSLSNPDSESSNTKSPPIKSEAPDTKNESSKPDSPTIRSEAQETKTALTKTGTKTATIGNFDLESSETDSVSIKSEAPETEIDTQSPSIHTFESPELANASTTAKTRTTTIRDADSESSETDSPPNKSADSESNPAPTAKAKTATISDPNADNPEPSIINFETLGPLKELSVTDSPLNRSEAQETRTENSDRELPPRHTRTSRATKDNSKTKSPPNQRKAAKATERKGPQSTIHMNEDLTTSASTPIGTKSRSLGNLDSELHVTDSLPIGTEARETKTENPDEEFSTRQTRTSRATKENPDEEFSTRQTRTSRATKARESKDPQSTTNMNEDITTSDVHNLTCSSNQSAYLKSQTNSSVTLTLSPLGNYSQLCILKWSESNVSQCLLSNSSSDVTIDGLDSGRLYNFSVYFLKDNKTHLSESSCTVGPYYTRPEGPDCSKFNQTGPNIVNTTNNFEIYLFSNNLCANVTSMKNKSDSHLVFGKSIDLSAATSYKILLFKYLNGSNGPLLSAERCPLGIVHTLPEKPGCLDIPKMVSVTNRTSENITLNTSSLTNRSEKLCVQIYPNHSYCKPVGLTTMFDNLTSSSNYIFSVFSYYNVSENGLMVLSDISCPLGNSYTLPENPNCEGIKHNITVKHITATSITLDFTNLAEKTRESLCVKIQSNETCRTYINPTMKFDRLHISQSYNFFVFSYFNDTNNNQSVLSQSSCNITNYTGPDIPLCNSSIVSNKTTTSIVLDLRNLETTGAERYIAEIFENESESNERKHFNISNNSFEHITNLTQGTAYTLQIFAVSEHNIRSADSCQVKSVYTYPGQPTKPTRYLNKNETSLMFSWGRPVGNVDNYSLTVQCHCSCSSSSNTYPKIVSSNVITESVTGLEPGTYCSVNITAISGRLHSTPLQYTNLETNEIAPGEVSDVNVTDIKSSSFTISWSKPNKPNGDLIKYNVNMSTPATTKNVSISSPSTSFDGLQPGICYNVTVAAVNTFSEGKKIFTTVYTTETVPSSVTDLKSWNTSSTSIAVTWSKPQSPNGVIRGYQIFVWKEEGNSLKNIITLTCEGCQRPCPTALPQDNLQKSSPPYVNKGKDGKTPAEEVLFTESNTTLHYEVTGLEIFTSYSFNVTAFTSKGHGEWATNVRNTSEDIPSSVTNLTSLNTSSTSIAVTWSKPNNTNGVIRRYQIFVKKTNEQEEGNNLKQIITLKCDCCQRPCPTAVPQDRGKDETDEKTTVHEVSFTESNTTLHYEVTGLEIFTSYTFNVTAFTSVGHGKWETNVRNTSEDKPSTPGPPVESNVQIGNLSFVYNKPEKENGVITNQEIEYSYKPYDVCAEDSEYEHNVTKTNTTGIIDNGDKFNASLKNLQPFWRYTIRVRVSTYAGFSNYSQPTTIQTLPTTPAKVLNIKAAQTFSRRIDLRWAQPCQPHGLIINYTIGVSNRNDSSNSVNDIRFTNNSRTSFNVIHLLPYRSYQFTVRTQVEGVTQLSTPQISIFQTSTEAPYPLGNITVNITSTSVTLLWKAPELETGPTNYIVTAIDNETSRQNGSCKTQGFYNTSCSIHGLDAYWPYLLIVYVKVEDFPEKNKTIDIRTLESAPGRVSRFTVTQDPNVTAETNVHIEWSPPVKRDLNGVIQTYFIKYWYQPNKETILSFDQRRTKASVIVQAEERYTFQIFAQTTYNATEKDYLSRNITINPGAPIPPPKQKVPLINKGPPASDDQTQIAVAFSQAALCKNSNGKINKWYIIVSKTPEGQVFIGARKDYLKKIEKIYKKWEDVYEKDVNDPYIASDTWNPHCESGSRRKRSAPLETISYTLGSDGDCESGNRKYCNGNLEPGQTYRVRYAVCTNGGCLESEFSEPFQTAPNHVPAIAGSLTAVVLVLAVIIVVIIILKRRGKGPFKSLDNGEVGQQNEAFAGVEMKGTSKPKAVKIADFANYVQKLHADSNLLFSSEYKLLKETCPTHTTKAAEVQVNRIKNRYTNILSYDHSRVKLLPTEDDEGSDYINANYMPGYTSPREYIATQGPLPFTRDDFWRMIWEQNVSIIVMLTQLVERGRRKCDIYWPEASREPVYYGDLVVELESESTLPDYVLRVMSIKLGNRVRKVKQLHYLKWPDMGCPETTWLLLNFVGATRLYLPHNDPGPIVVHCSAGVGRTGTFIAVDYLMQHVRTSDVIDIYSYVMKMRNNRPNMVQTEDQYVFIHDCIKDYVNKNDDDTDDEEEEEEKQEDQSIYMNV